MCVLLQVYTVYTCCIPLQLRPAVIHSLITTLLSSMSALISQWRFKYSGECPYVCSVCNYSSALSYCVCECVGIWRHWWFNYTGLFHLTQFCPVLSLLVNQICCIAYMYLHRIRLTQLSCLDGLVGKIEHQSRTLEARV